MGAGVGSGVGVGESVEAGEGVGVAVGAGLGVAVGIGVGVANKSFTAAQPVKSRHSAANKAKTLALSISQQAAQVFC